MEQTQKIYLDDVLCLLDNREQGVLKLYYWAGFSEEEIADSLEISQQAIHKIKKRALQKCRQQLTEINMTL